MGQTSRTRVTFVFALIALVGAMLQPPPARAQNVVGVVAAGLTGRMLLDDAERRVNRKMTEVENIANGLMAQAITGVTMAIQSARINSEALLDKPLAALKETERSAFYAIRDASSQMDQLADKAYRLEEVANVDASTLLGSIPPIADAIFISSIRGISILQTRPEHKVTVIGTGLGSGNSRIVGKLEVWHGGTLLVPSRVDSSEHNTTTLYFAPTTFAAHFRPDQVVTLPLTVKLKTVRSRWYWTDAEQEVSTKTPFTLYPPTLGTAAVVADVPNFGWVFTRAERVGWTMRDCGAKQCGDGGVHEERKHAPGVEGDTPTVGFRRLTNVTCTCGAPWWGEKACEYSQPLTCQISDNAKQVQHSWQVNGIWGTRYANYSVETYARTGATPTPQPPVPVLYGDTFSFCIPATVDLYTVRVRTLTKETFTLTPGESVPDRIIYASNFTCNANEKRILYRVPSPR